MNWSFMNLLSVCFTLWIILIVSDIITLAVCWLIFFELIWYCPHVVVVFLLHSSCFNSWVIICFFVKAQQHYKFPNVSPSTWSSLQTPKVAAFIFLLGVVSSPIYKMSHLLGLFLTVKMSCCYFSVRGVLLCCLESSLVNVKSNDDKESPESSCTSKYAFYCGWSRRLSKRNREPEAEVAICALCYRSSFQNWMMSQNQDPSAETDCVFSSWDWYCYWKISWTSPSVSRPTRWQRTL